MTSPNAVVGTDIAKADVVVACRLDAHEMTRGTLGVKSPLDRM